MLKRLHIQNFRGFNTIKIDPLSRINLIAGKNNSGKTSLLEAVFLLSGAGNAQMAVNPHVIRGAESGAPLQDPFWKHLFYNLDMGRRIEIKGYYKSRGELALKITSEREPTTEMPLERTNRISATNLFDERSLAFQYSDSGKKKVKSYIWIEGQDFKSKQPSINVLLPAVILLSRNRNVYEDATRLGQLKKQKKGDLLLRALQVIEPKLQSIEENSSSGTPMIWGDVGLSEMVPLPAMGEGMTQIARIVLAIAYLPPKGAVLIDEVENGIHHSVLPNVWQAIDEAAKQFDSQIFATTHSFECVEAAHQALGSDGFRLHRLEARDGENRCVTYAPDSIAAAIKHGLEVR